MTNQQKADRLALIQKIAERQKREKATALRMAKLKTRSKSLVKRVPKKKRDFMEIPKESNMYQWTDASSCLLYTSPSPRDVEESRMPSSA